MELRKDPLTRSWVMTGDDLPEIPSRPSGDCRLCPGALDKDKLQQVSTRPPVQGGPWSARAVVHPAAIYHIEGKLDRRGDTITAYRSPDGNNWQLVGFEVIELSENVYVGLAITSQVGGAGNVSTFDNVSVVGHHPLS